MIIDIAMPRATCGSVPVSASACTIRSDEPIFKPGYILRRNGAKKSTDAHWECEDAIPRHVHVTLSKFS
jgi:hypothetical protein